MKRNTVIAALLAIVGLFAFSACGPVGTPVAQPSTIPLVQEKCNLCHSMDLALNAHKSPDDWRATVLRMKNTNGCPITDEEAETIIQYLSITCGTIPAPPPPSEPQAVAALQQAVERGRQLFSDPNWGTTGQTCATCHPRATYPRNWAGWYPKPEDFFEDLRLYSLAITSIDL